MGAIATKNAAPLTELLLADLLINSYVQMLTLAGS